MSRPSDDHSNSNRLFCDAWNGSRTPGFAKFKRDFETGADAMFLHEDDYSVWQACVDMDQGGGGTGADALPGAQQNGFANAVRRRKKRQAKAFERIFSHMEDERIKDMLHALPHNDRRGAEAWAMVLRECDQGTSDLEILDLKRDFQNSTIESEIGYSEETIIKFSRLLNSLNAKIPHAKRYDENEMSIKLLSNIASPESLALEAVKELRADTGSRAFEHQVMVNGNQVTYRHYQAMVSHFDSVWRGLFKQGVIRARAPGKRHDAGAMFVDEAREVNDQYDEMEDEEDHAYWVRYGKGKGKGGRGGRGGRFGRYGKGGGKPSQTQSNASQSRPHMCDVCWRSIMDASEQQRAALIQAISNRPARRAYQVEDGAEPAQDDDETNTDLHDSSRYVDQEDYGHDDGDSLVDDYVRRVTFVDSNAAVDAVSRHSTSVNLGLAADSVAQPDYDMASSASWPIEHILDEVTNVQPAFRNGRNIGHGLYASRDINPGTCIAKFGDGRMMKERDWDSYASERGLNPEWSGIKAERCLPPPTKAYAPVMLYDASWHDNFRDRRPKWSYLNHSNVPNVKMKLPRTGYTVAWFTMEAIVAGTELCFAYGGDIDDYEEEESENFANDKRPRRHSTSLNNHNENLFGPYKHRPRESFSEDEEPEMTVQPNADYAEQIIREREWDSIISYSGTHRQQQRKNRSSAKDGVKDERPPLRRLRSLLLCLQHARRTLRCRMLELHRRFVNGWNARDSLFTSNEKRAPRPRWSPPRWYHHTSSSQKHDQVPTVPGASRPNDDWYDYEDFDEYRNDPRADVCRRVQQDGVWVADSGCSVHCVSDASLLTTVTHKGSDRKLNVADKRAVFVECTGTIEMDVVAVDHHGKEVIDHISLARVLVVPSFKSNLFSCSAGSKTDGLRTVLDGPDEPGFIELASRNRIYFTGQHKYEFLLRSAGDSACVADDAGGSGMLNHRRLAHFSDARLKSSGVDTQHDPALCDACSLNLKRAAFSSHSRAQQSKPPRATRFGQLVNSDLLSMPESAQGYRYIMVFVDEFSSEAAIRFLKSKAADAVLQALQSYVAEYAHMMDGGRVGTWHTDNGGEFESSEIDAYCNAVSTHQSKTPAHTPELNGKSERLNGVILRGVRILLAESNLTEGLWPYAATHVIAVHNRLTSRALVPPTSPYELNRKRKPNLDKYRVWGCKCFVQLEKEERTQFGLLKTDSAGMTAVHLGYDHIRRGYYVYIPQIKRYTTVRTIKFDEDHWLEVPELTRHERVAPARKHLARVEQDRVQAGIANRLGRAMSAPNTANYVSSGRYAQRVLKVSDEGPIPTPKTYAEAVNSQHASQWKLAMRDDLQGKRQNGPNGAWTLVDASVPAKLGRTPLKGKWVFKIKYEVDGYTINKFKARWVGCGYAQRDGVDYNETFASTIRAVTVRILLATAAHLDLMLGVFDVVKAFTQSEMHEVLFVQQPTGFEKPGKVCRLNMALEGTKQAAHLWQQNLNTFMVEFGFDRSLADPCLYMLREGEILLIAAVHVDDVLCAYNDNERYDKFWVKFSQRFKATRGPMEVYLGMEVTRDRDARSITLTQSVYIEKLFAKYLSAGNTKTWSMPIDMSRDGAAKFQAITCAESERQINEMSGKDFNGILGSLLYATCMTRPDVAYYVAFLCQFMQAPTVDAHDAALSVMAYLYATKDLGISFTGGSQRCNIDAVDMSKDRLVVYSDASFGRETMPFAGGFVQWRGGPVSWVARKAKFVPQSSCESEVFGAVMLLKESEFAAQVINFLSSDLSLPTASLVDNKAAVDVIKHPGATKRTVHFDRWLHFARSLCLLNKVEVFLVSTDDMMGDIFTKALDKTKFLKCRDYILTKRP